MATTQTHRPNIHADRALRAARYLGRAFTLRRRAPISVMPAYEPSMGYNEMLGLGTGIVLGLAFAVPIYVICCVRAGAVGAAFGLIPAGLAFQIAYLFGRHLWPMVWVMLIVAVVLIANTIKPVGQTSATVPAIISPVVQPGLFDDLIPKSGQPGAQARPSSPKRY